MHRAMKQAFTSRMSALGEVRVVNVRDQPNAARSHHCEELTEDVF